MSYAVIKAGGKQFRVTEGDVIDINRVDLEVGDVASFEEVLMVSHGSSAVIGSPTVSGATVTAKVVDQFRGDKVIAFKFKRRKGYHKTKGHRQHLTKLEITSITA